METQIVNLRTHGEVGYTLHTRGRGRYWKVLEDDTNTIQTEWGVVAVETSIDTVTSIIIHKSV